MPACQFLQEARGDGDWDSTGSADQASNPPTTPTLSPFISVSENFSWKHFVVFSVERSCTYFFPFIPESFVVLIPL